jgi:hypothetical protein
VPEVTQLLELQKLDLRWTNLQPPEPKLAADNTVMSAVRFVGGIPDECIEREAVVEFFQKLELAGDKYK